MVRELELMKIENGCIILKSFGKLTKINIKDLTNYYINENKSYLDTCNKFKLSKSTLNRIILKLDLFKAKEQIAENIKNIKSASSAGFIFLDNNKFQYNYKLFYIKDLYDYYIIKNHTVKELVKHFNLPKNILVYIRAHIKDLFNKSKKQISETRSRLWVELSQEEKNTRIKKMKEAQISKYGDMHSRLPEVRKYLQEIQNNKTADEKQDIINKGKETCLKKFGKLSFSQTEEFKEKYRQRCQEKWGVNSASQAEEVIEKEKETWKNKTKEELEIIKLRHLMGFYQYKGSNIDEFKKLLQENKLRYPEEKINTMMYKSNKTKIKNNSFNTSKPEEETYNKLCIIFDKDNVVRQYDTRLYESTNRYPFKCDFYIKSLDLFIELNLGWRHGSHSFNSNNLKDINTLNKWQNKVKNCVGRSNGKAYKIAIDVWTVRDPKKLACAKEHNLNYVTVYNIKELTNFIEELEKKYGKEINSVANNESK